MASKNTERLSLVIDSGLKREFEKLCKVERRSMSSQIVLLVEQAVAEARQQGKIQNEQTPAPISVSAGSRGKSKGKTKPRSQWKTSPELRAFSLFSHNYERTPKTPQIARSKGFGRTWYAVLIVFLSSSYAQGGWFLYLIYYHIVRDRLWFFDRIQKQTHSRNVQILKGECCFTTALLPI